MKDKYYVTSLGVIASWYFIFFLCPYNALAESMGNVDLGGGHSWPLAFFLMDGLVLTATAVYITALIRGKFKKYKNKWILLGLSLIFPLVSVWATVMDLVISPIRR